MIVLDPALLEQVLSNIREAARREKDHSRPAERFPVWLHVYDLSHTARLVLNNWFSKMSGFGAFHCGIEVLGAEWSFQAPPGEAREDDDRTGLMCHQAKVHPVHVYKESIFLGESRLRVSDIWNLLLQLERQWLANSYHVVRRNCTDFADAFAIELRVPECVPSWVHGIAKGYLRHTPLANVQSSMLPASCGSVSASESGYSTTASVNSVAASRDAPLARGNVIFLKSAQEVADEKKLPEDKLGSWPILDKKLPPDAAAVDAAAGDRLAPRPLSFAGDMFSRRPSNTQTGTGLRPAEFGSGTEFRVVGSLNDGKGRSPPDPDEVQKALRKAEGGRRNQDDTFSRRMEASGGRSGEWT